MKTGKGILGDIVQKCLSTEGRLKKLDENGTGYYCFMNPENIFGEGKCKYQGDLVVSKDNHIHVRCEFRDMYSKMSKRTPLYLLPSGC